MLLQYIEDKLKDLLRQMEISHNYLLKAAQDLNIKSIEASTKKINEITSKQRDYATDIVKYLSVSEAVSLCKADLISKDYLSYSYRFPSSAKITVGQRDFLVQELGWNFKEAKIK